MQLLSIMASIILIVALIATFVNFRLLMYPFIPSLNPAAHAKQLSLRGNILFISDLHLKSNKPFDYARELRNFIEANDVSNLVINGDFFDSPKDAQEILGISHSPRNALRVLGLEGLPLGTYWVTGSPHHDPSSLPSSLSETESIFPLGKCALIDCGRLKVMTYHGHDLSHKGAFGHAWNRFVSNLALEKLWRRLTGVDESVWIVFGHTHVPGVDLKGRVANCGGWQKKPFVLPSRTGILISQDQDAPKLVQIA
jgi:UDP-2,3-diacylglucosamine pyrophosphatase LpxH